MEVSTGNNSSGAEKKNATHLRYRDRKPRREGNARVSRNKQLDNGNDEQLPPYPSNPEKESPTNINTEKPLPAVPMKNEMGDMSFDKTLPPKPLPDPPEPYDKPRRFSYYTMIAFIGAFWLSFLAIVLLLPVITERDAMPGLNRLLWGYFYSIKGSKPTIKRHDHFGLSFEN
ncbi:hypothetical protein K469DRAFT_695005 [Zopfia rhizophila CBS 207.26]|uniref:Uncharacterized protein n=1 Tax=Zopfia rhizophila CBS 207.26 TaxID=1314779 RepID=A0A6A6DHY2_9PEZI|nr:hypothetical protein K469DRAFT_695005 [Zopfia rhizophila CBS 207.26]